MSLRNNKAVLNHTQLGNATATGCPTIGLDCDCQASAFLPDGPSACYALSSESRRFLGSAYFLLPIPEAHWLSRYLTRWLLNLTFTI